MTTYLIVSRFAVIGTMPVKEEILFAPAEFNVVVVDGGKGNNGHGNGGGQTTVEVPVNPLARQVPGQPGWFTFEGSRNAIYDLNYVRTQWGQPDGYISAPANADYWAPYSLPLNPNATLIDEATYNRAMAENALSEAFNGDEAARLARAATVRSTALGEGFSAADSLIIARQWWASFS